MPSDQDDANLHYHQDYFVVSIALEILSAGSKKSAVKKLTTQLGDRRQAREFVDIADDYLKLSYGPKWKKQPKETWNRYREQQTEIIETMEATGLSGEEATEMLYGEAVPGDSETDMLLDDEDFINSPHSQTHSFEGRSFDIQIYRLGQENVWQLEVVDDRGTSHCWDDFFEDDAQALEAAIKDIPEIARGG